MRGADVQQGGLFSYVSVESRVPASRPLRAVRHGAIPRWPAPRFRDVRVGND